MLGYEYEIIYKKGRDIISVYSLSKQYEDVGSLLTLLGPIPMSLVEAFQEWLTNPGST